MRYIYFGLLYPFLVTFALAMHLLHILTSRTAQMLFKWSISLNNFQRSGKLDWYFKLIDKK